MFGLGSRLTGRTGPYTMGGVGGHIRMRPIRWVAVELFTDHVIGPVDNTLRHDHEGGVALQFPVLGNRWWNVYPLIGACASLVVLEPSRQGGPFVTDVHFGFRGGAGSELYLTDHWALRAQVEGIGYIGHDLRAYDWTATLSPDVRLTGMAQASFTINLYL
jgi:opacity protein-like surface antigen